MAGAQLQLSLGVAKLSSSLVAVQLLAYHARGLPPGPTTQDFVCAHICKQMCTISGEERAWAWSLLKAWACLRSDVMSSTFWTRYAAITAIPGRLSRWARLTLHYDCLAVVIALCAGSRLKA